MQGECLLLKASVHMRGFGRLIASQLIDEMAQRHLGLLVFSCLVSIEK